MFNLKYKNEKGSITLYVLVAMLLMISVLTIVYMQINQKNANQLKELTSIQKEYQSNNKNMDDSYNQVIDNNDIEIYILLTTADGKQYTVDQWTNENLNLKIYYPAGVPDNEKYYYKDGEKIKYTENEIIDDNCTISVEYGGEVKEVKITKIDKTSPTINSLTVLDTTISSLKINVKASDNLSGIKTYKYYLGNTLIETSELDTYTYTGLASGTEYTLRVEVIDNLGNTSSDSTVATTLKPVARIESVYYGTLQSAIDAVPNDNTETTVTLLTNISENVEINENKNIILDLDNYAITNSTENHVITSSGKLAIKDGSITGTYTNKVSTICVNANSELSLSNSIIDRNSDDDYSWETIELYGDLNIDSGKINNANSNAICTYADYDTNILISGTAQISSVSSTAIYNRAEMTITGGTITSTNSTVIYNYGTVNISGTAQISSASTTNVAVVNQSGATMSITGGTINAPDTNAISNYGKLEIGGTAKLSSTNSIVISNRSGGTATITGGRISSTNSAAIANQSGGTATITGGTITSTNSTVISNESGGTATITGGTISSTNNGALANDGTVNISGTAQISSASTTKVAVGNLSGATMTITGGTINAPDTNAISNNGKLEIGGTAKLSSTNLPTISNRGGGTATITGGTITSTNSTVISNESGGTATITGGTISSTNGAVIYNSGTVNISGTAQISSASTTAVAVSNQSGATMKITGGTMNAPDTNAISNNGKLEIGGTAKLSSTNSATISNRSGGTVTIIGGTISSTNSSAISNQSGGTATITGGTISSPNSTAIYNQSGGTATITGGTISSPNSNAINNYGTLKVSGTAKITASNKSYPTLYNQSGATATISGGTISNTAGGYSIYNKGSATKTGGTVSGPTYRNLNITNVTKM